MQYELVILLITPVLFGVLNMIRGSANPVPWFKGKIFNALVYALVLTVLFSSSLPPLSLLVLVCLSIPAMLIAMSFGWGEYVGAQLEGRPKRDAEVPLIDALIKGLEGTPRLWGFAGNTLRGLVAGALLSIPFLMVDMVGEAFMVILGATLMGTAFAIASIFPKSFDRWKIGEAFMGAFIGLGVAISALLRKKK